jgi:hypothetical protein
MAHLLGSHPRGGRNGVDGLSSSATVFIAALARQTTTRGIRPCITGRTPRPSSCPAAWEDVAVAPPSPHLRPRQQRWHAANDGGGGCGSGNDGGKRR